MDEFVKNVLKEWELECLEEKFAENCIDKENFLLLDENSIKELIPVIGHRIKFQNNYNILKAPVYFSAQACIENSKLEETSSECTSLTGTLSAVTDTSSESLLQNFTDNSLPGPSNLGVTENTNLPQLPSQNSTTETIYCDEVGPSTIKRSCAYNSAYLNTLLRKSSTGQYILAKYDQCKILDRDTRQKLVEIIIEDHLANNLDTRISSYVFNYIATAIVELFPNECKESYFTTISTTKGKIGKGKLFTKFYNLRRKLKEVGLLNQAKKSKEKILYEPTKDEDELLLWLQSSTTPVLTVVDYWEKTFEARSKLKSELTTQEYLHKFPYLLTSNGFELFENDFVREFPEYNLKLYSNVDKFFKALQEYIGSTKQEHLINKCNTTLHLENYDLKVTQLFSLLASLLPTVTVAKIKNVQWKPSRIEIVESFILYLPNIGDLHGILENRKDKLSKFKQQLQPFIIVIGTEISITEVYICIDEIIYKITTPLKAIDICFKIFHTLNLKYPVECERLWLIIQLSIYEMATRCLDLQCKEEKIYTLKILNYADLNVTVVHGFYKDNYMNENIGRFLQELVRREYIGCIKTIFENPDEQTKNHINKYDLLAICASTENVEILKILLSHVDINSKIDDQDIALHVLAEEADLKGIKFLVRHGADVNVPNAAGDPLLFTFIRGNQSNEPHDWDEVFKTLQLKADFSLTNSNNETLLHAAVTRKQPELIDFLIENGSQVNQTDNKGWTPLDSLYHLISFYFYFGIDDYVPILEKLLTLGATSNNINDTNYLGDSRGFLLLNGALKLNNLNLLESLLNSGVDVNSRGCHQQTVLHTCAAKKYLKATQILIKYNADCYVKDRHGDTPLFYFAQYRRNEHINMDFIYDKFQLNFLLCNPDSNDDENVDMIKNMLDLLQCHPGHVDAAGNTVLHRAVKHFKLKLAEMLIKHYKFDVNVQNSDGNTPLHVLISSLNDNYDDLNKKDIITMIETLKNHNVRLDQNNKLNETPLDMLQKICTAAGDNTIINDLRPYLTPAPSSVNNRKRKLDS